MTSKTVLLGLTWMLLSACGGVAKVGSGYEGSGAAENGAAAGSPESSGGSFGGKPSSAGGTFATGGVTSAGGSFATGGVTSSGGSFATGGVTSSGGSLATGGVTSSGGSFATGGVSGVGGIFGCTPPFPLFPCISPPSPIPPGPSLCGGVECAQMEECCLLTMKCFDRSSLSACPKPPPDADSQSRPTCASNADCAPEEYCQGDSFSICAGSGHCQSRTNCGGTSDGSFCGCDGKTYPNGQTACLAGVRMNSWVGCGQQTTLGGATDGPLVTLCGSDTQCPSGEHCCGITGLCYDDAHAAICVVPPAGTSRACLSDSDCIAGSEFCDGPGCSGLGGCLPLGGSCGPLLEPVCGCDGKSYVNVPCAQSVGMRVASQGQCP